jgi:carotenoid cleavage dioxygenase-like enzyme
MNQAVATNPFLSGNYAPIPTEFDEPDLPVQGELPKELNGTLYRNGPNPQFEPRDNNYHWFIGDGMIHAFHIEEGRVSYKNRWVQTPKWQLEHKAGRALFGSWGNPRTSAWRALGRDDGVANTNIVWHGGRLLALEEAHRPFEIDPESLGPRGYLKLKGVKRFTAHPKLDPETGETIFFGYGADRLLSPGMIYGVIDRQGRLTKLERFEAPFSSMVHDFIVTRNYVLFPILPLTGSMKRAMAGKPIFAWEPEMGSHVGVMRRDGSVKDIRWFKSEACYVFHPMNAHEEGDKIVAEVMQYEAAPFFPDPEGRPGDPQKATARLCRWTFDLTRNSDEFRRDYIDELVGEFPRFDERRAGLPYRHGFYAASPTTEAKIEFSAIAHLDLASGKRALYRLPEGDAISEPVFVPRAADAPEGDGWLLAVAYRAAENRSDLIVLDTSHIEAGPIATAALSHRVPHGFHGNWRAMA